MQKQLLLSLLTAATLFMAGCGGTEDSRAVPVTVPTNPGGAPVTGVLTANFDPTTGVVPTPNNLVYSGTADGTLNLPVADAGDFGDPLVAINSLDGWSTTAPMSTTFSAAVNPATVQPGVTVRIFNVTLSGHGGAVTGVNSELQAGVDFVALMSPSDTTGRTLVILPLRALPQKSHFAVVLTNGIQDPAGNAATPSQIYHIVKRTSPLVDGGGNSTDPLLPNANAQALEPLRQLTNAREIAISAFSGVARANMVLSWTVSTQSVTDVIDYVAANAASADNFFVATGNQTPGTLANIFVGYIDLPYGLQAPDDIDPQTPDPTRILSGFWQGAGGSNLTRFNPAVVWRSTQRVPAVLTIPAAPPPVDGYPVVIFQHGITGHRGQAMGMADAAANAGFAVISIDQPLHGIAAGDATFGSMHASQLNLLPIPGFDSITERTFNVDLVNNTTGAPGPDGNVDGSGTHTINLASLLTARDNLRQASADLLTVAATIGDLFTFDGVNPLNIPFDTSRIHFVGHSLGAIVGTSTVGAAGGDISVATLGMPGGGIARLLDGSPTFAPRIRAGLAAAGVAYPSADYDRFMFAAQTVVDSADPINHAARASTNAAIHMIAVVGDGGANLPDQVVPNAVAGAPTSGTLPLAAAMGLANISVTTVDAGGVRGLVRFTAGDHGSLLQPAPSAAAFTEMATQLATFLGSTGTVLQITDTTVIQP